MSGPREDGERGLPPLEENVNIIAYLSNKKDCIQFSFNNRNIRFKGPYSLEKINRIVE